MSYKLFIPGPIAVSEKTLRAMAQPLIGHRSTDFVALYNSIQPELQALMYTKDPVYLSKLSGIGKKTAEKIVAELKDVLGAEDWHDGSAQHTSDSDVVDALMALGYSQKDAREALQKLPEDITDTNERIRRALKSIGM